jgi:hypothetical protein
VYETPWFDVEVNQHAVQIIDFGLFMAFLLRAIPQDLKATPQTAQL